MTYNSFVFWVFLGVLFSIYWCLPAHRAKNLLLLLASFIFYAWFGIAFSLLLFVCTVINYSTGVWVSPTPLNIEKRYYLSLLLILACFLGLGIQWELYVRPDTPGKIFFSNAGFGIFLVVSGASIGSSLVYSRLIGVARERKRRYFLIAGISMNLFILGFFKYFNFFIENVERGLALAGFTGSGVYLKIALPVGVSFYTFKGISYLVDVYRGNLNAIQTFETLALYIAYFPSLLAGPIDRAGSFLRQIENKKIWDGGKIFEAFQLILYGLFKKVAIADGLLRSVDQVFSGAGRATWAEVLAGTLLFSIQIYCDFSGYTDIARGISKLFGIELMENFAHPYFAMNPREFWSKWHISLSSWLRDYLYIPLGGNRKGLGTTLRNILITMGLGGLWHGASWNFVIWGGYHGMLLCAHRLVQSLPRNPIKAAKGASWALLKLSGVFLAVCYGWMLFRADSLDQILRFSQTLIFDFGNMQVGDIRPRFGAIFGLPLLLIIEIVEFRHKGERFYDVLSLPIWTGIFALILFGIFLGMSNETSQFIYFNF